MAARPRGDVSFDSSWVDLVGRADQPIPLQDLAALWAGPGWGAVGIVVGCADMAYRRLAPSFAQRCRQAHFGPEELSSLVTQAGRSQPGREGSVNPRSLKTMILFPFDEDRGLTDSSRSGSLVVDWVTREVESDPQRNPATLLPQAPRQTPSPLESGPPEAAFRPKPAHTNLGQPKIYGKLPRRAIRASRARV